MDFRYYDIPTDRKLRVLESVIRLYTEQAEPVSSAAVSRALQRRWSSATVRNVFMELEELGWLTQPHRSAGRVPTDLGYRVFVEQIVTRGCMANPMDQVLEAELDPGRQSLIELIDQATVLLSRISHALGLSVLVFSPENELGDNRIQIAGVDQLLGQPEFDDPGRLKVLVRLLDDSGPIGGYLGDIAGDPGEVTLQIGEENTLSGFKNFTLVTTRIYRSEEKALVGILGPVRMEYPLVLGAMSSLVRLLHTEDTDPTDSWS
ncbi:MAG: hypothetical protein GY835_06030 [bacterium]|nr:hypothetical protein [bacterium]